MDADLVVEVGTGPSTGGKAPILLQVPADARHLLGIDVDQQRLSGVLVDLRGNVLVRESCELEGRDGEEALAQLDVLVSSLQATAKRPVLGVGVGTPGLVDTATGTVRWAVGLDWRDVPLGPRLSARTGLPATVINDSQAAAMAEWTFGRHDTSTAMVVIKVGEGIGAGIVLGGRVYSGDGSGAGEIGHTRVSESDTICRCGSSGCLETVASLRAVLQRTRELAPTRDDSSLSAETVDHQALQLAFDAADPLAQDVVLEAARSLGRVVAAVIGTLGARDVVLIGPMTDYGPAWLEAVRAEADRSSLPLLAQRSTIHFGRTGREAVELGAAAMLMASQLGLALTA